MPKRSIARVLRIVRAAAAASVVLAILVAARLSQGPVDLNYFKPDLERALSAAFGAAQASIGHLSLDASDGRVALTAYNVATSTEAGDNKARAARVNMRLDFAGLMRGQVRPSRLDVVGAKVIATRDADGRLKLLASAEAETSDEQKDDTADLFDLARAWTSGGADLDDLPDIRLENVRLIALDSEFGEPLWEGRGDAGATLTPTRALVWVELAIDPERQATPLRLSATLAKNEGGDAALTFDRADLVTLSRVARLFGLAAPPVEGAVDGAARIVVDQDLRPVSASLDLTGRDIELALPDRARVAIDDISIVGEADPKNGRLAITGLRMGKPGAAVIGAASLQADDGGFKLSGRIDHADLAYVAALAQQAAAVEGLDAAFASDFDVSFRNGEVAAAEMRLTADAKLNMEEMFYGPLEVKKAAVFIAYDGAARTLSLTGLDATLAGARATGEAKATLDEAWDLDVLDGRIRVGAFPVETLPALWPKAFSPGGRAWVARNLSGGDITGGDFVLAKASGEELQASGTFAAEGLNVRYWDPMPTATGVAGVGRIEGDTLSMDVTKGAAGGMRTKDVKVVMSKLGAPKEFISVNGVIEGPASNLLAVLDRKPLGYASWLGVDPAAVKGDVSGRLKMKFPLIDKLSVDDLDVSAVGKAHNAVLPKAVKGWDLHAKSMDIAVNTSRLKVSGAGALLKQPISFDGHLAFGRGEERARFKGDWRLTRDVRRALGLGGPAIRKRLTGVTPAAFDVIVRPKELYEIGIDANLADATLLAQEIGWLKPKGAKARLKAKAIIQGDKPLRIDGLMLAAKDLTLETDVVFNPRTGGVDRVTVQRLKGAGHDLAADVVFGAEADRIRVYGRRADLRPLLELNRDAAAEEPEIKPPPHRRHFQIDVGQARLTEAMALTDVNADFTLFDGWPTAMRASARYDGGELRLAPDPEAGWMRMTANNFGGLVAATKATAAIDKGTAHLRVSKHPEGGYGLEFRASKFDFAKQEIVRLGGDGAKPLLGLLGAGDDIRFDKMDLFGHYDAGRLDINKGQAAGAALGMSATGMIDFRGRKIDIGGAIAPAYGISRAIGVIPILGELLTGTKREGVFAANYRTSGDLDDPTFRVNGLSALAPGILREVLGATPKAEGTQKPGRPEWENNEVDDR